MFFYIAFLIAIPVFVTAVLLGKWRSLPVGRKAALLVSIIAFECTVFYMVFACLLAILSQSGMIDLGSERLIVLHEYLRPGKSGVYCIAIVAISSLAAMVLLLPFRGKKSGQEESQAIRGS